MLERFIARLEQARFDIGDEDIADAIWLALHMGPVEPLATVEPTSEASTSTVVVEEEAETPVEPRETSDSLSAFPADAVSQPPDETTPPEQGLPFQAPAATALQNALELGRSLRPLMRKVASRSYTELDEEATVQRIVEEEIWQPIMQPLPERWLDLELVVEASPQSFIWEQTIDEFQHKVLERQGAFRNVRAWNLQADNRGTITLVPRKPGGGTERPHDPKELMHSSGRQLVLLVSDGQSDLWHQHPLPQAARTDRQTPKTLHEWLKRWSSQGPTALVQLLPEWLWDRSALKPGFPAQLSAFEPGVPNPQLVVEELTRRQQQKADLPHALILPVFTLDAEPLFQWAQVVAGAGLVRTPGRVFNLYRLAQYRDTALATETEALSAEVLVERFLATASPAAQQLAGYMAAAPVSLPVVHLIQARLMRHPTPVQVAEVYMSGLLKPVGTSELTGQPIYEFKDGVRQLLNRAIATDATEKVLNTLSAAIAEKLDLVGSIDSFAAFLSPDPEWLDQDRTVARFAEVLPEVLRNLGGHFATLADYAQVRPRPGPTEPTVEIPTSSAETEFVIPPLEEFEYPVAVVEIQRESEPEEEESSALKLRIQRLESEIEQLSRQRRGFLELKQFEDLEDLNQLINVKQRELERLRQELRQVETLERNQESPQGPQGFLSTTARLEVTTEAGEKTIKIIRSDQWHPGFNEDLGHGVQLGLVEIPGGEFMMGSPEEEDGYSDERPQHSVTVPTFFMGRFPVTRAQWRVVAGWERVEQDLEPDPSSFKGKDLSEEDRDRLPVEQVSWYGAMEFCQRLSHRTGKAYRLPSEAEWEYACRAGTTTPFYFGETITPDLANYDGNSTYGDGPKGEYRQKTTPVGYFEAANGFGLYDMHGNVWEWCLDHWHEGYEISSEKEDSKRKRLNIPSKEPARHSYLDAISAQNSNSPKRAPADGSAWLSEDEKASRVIRGGSWLDNPRNCRSAYRNCVAPDLRNHYLGFRVVCAPPRTLNGS